MYYLQSRYYNPQWGRFINADNVSITLEDQGNLIENNLFVYALNNPVNMVDPDGDIAWFAVIGVVCLALSIYDVYVAVKKPTFENIAWAAIGFIPGGKSAKPIAKVSKATTKTITTVKRVFNVTKQESKIWKQFKSVKSQKYKTTGVGKNQRYYDWDYTHNDIEVYDRNGKHLGSMNPITGEIYKKAVIGRKLK